MKRLLSVLTGAIVLIGTPVNAQQATERYIPIGESPGASQTYTYLGRIIAVDAVARTITVEEDSGRHSIRVTDSTNIWLDNTRDQQSNSTATYADCAVGRYVEVMHLREDRLTASWIKIRAD